MDGYSKMRHSPTSPRKKGQRCELAFVPPLVRLLTHCRWHDAIRTLAKLHRIAPSSVGLESFGKPTAFYNRQIKTFRSISSSQAQAVDIETKILVGNIPHYDDTVAFLQDPRTQPQDRGTLIHGDYKIDNLVYHKIEPKVIGIIE